VNVRRLMLCILPPYVLYLILLIDTGSLVAVRVLWSHLSCSSLLNGNSDFVHQINLADRDEHPLVIHWYISPLSLHSLSYMALMALSCAAICMFLDCISLIFGYHVQVLYSLLLIRLNSINDLCNHNGSDWSIGCLMVRQHRKVNLCQLRRGKAAPLARMANKIQCILPYVTW